MNIGQIELAARFFDLHAVGAGANHALQPQPLGAQRLRLRVHHQAPPLDRVDVLVRVKAEAHQIADRTDSLAPPARVDRLGRVLDHPQAVFACDRIQPVHVHWQPGQIDRDDGACARGDGRLDRIKADVARGRIDIDKHRPRTHRNNHIGGRHPGQRGGDHFVARTEIGDS